MDLSLRASQLPEPASLRGSIAELLRERIVAGGFKPGERLVEAEIARQLSTSRGPVREAIAELRAEGLVVERPRRGAFVAELSGDDVREIYELRGAIEARAARLIIEKGDQAALDHLAEIISGLRDAEAHNDRERFAELDSLFHSDLCRLSGNTRLYRAFIQYAGLLVVLLRLEITTQYETLDGLLHEHELLFEELRSGSATRAEAAVDKHLAQALDRVERMRASRRPNGDGSSVV